MNSWQHLDKEPSQSLVRENWERLKEKDIVAAKIMLEGLKLDFLEHPKLSWGCPWSMRTSSAQSLRLEEFLGPWLEAGIVAEGRGGDKGFFSRLFTVPKDKDKLRPIIDLSSLNKSIRKIGLRMQDLRSIPKLIKPGMWAVKLDLKDAYFHVPLHPSVWKYFRFYLRRKGSLPKSFFFKRMPFGLTTAPWAFSRILSPLLKILRLQGILVSAYLDDFLILAPSREEALRDTEVVIKLLQDHGFRINWAKSSVEPVRILEYLGVVLNLVDRTFCLPEEKVQRILHIFHESQKVRRISRRSLEAMVGFLTFAANYLKWGKLLLKPVLSWMNSNTSVLQRND